MIFDRIENLGTYLSAHESLTAVSGFITDFLSKPHEDGKYVIDGESIYANVSSYTTKPREGALFEAHKKYIDLQLMLDGSEFIGWSPLENVTQESEEYSKGGDIAFYSGDADINLPLKSGYFTLLFPCDAHMPCIAVDEPARVRKMVIKVKI